MSRYLDTRRAVAAAVWILGLGLAWSLPILGVIDWLDGRDDAGTAYYVPSRPADYYAVIAPRPLVPSVQVPSPTGR